ncbi:MAG: isoamylase early set domain-containing protein [Bacteroidetes bacterium]|nr:isoamylase early set domain-containing protein [Bacteroidota bacterium]
MVKYNPKTRKATFETSFEDARQVAVLGEFNNWNADAHPLKKSKNGKWKGDAKIEPGRYEFIYRVNEEQWELDDACERVTNAFGSQNSVFTASAVAAVSKQPAKARKKKKS